MLSGNAWWWHWFKTAVRYPRSYKVMYHLARYHWGHRHCDTADFHHSLGCDRKPERELS